VLCLGGLIAASMLATTAAGLLDLRRELETGHLHKVQLLRLPCRAV
jgi:hypothetical protein